jgi:hypothetical protein
MFCKQKLNILRILKSASKDNITLMSYTVTLTCSLEALHLPQKYSGQIILKIKKYGFYNLNPLHYKHGLLDFVRILLYPSANKEGHLVTEEDIDITKCAYD